jgi:hypothetical protein
MQMRCYRVEYGLQKQKPHKSLCGLGSWREQQQTIESIKSSFAVWQDHTGIYGVID